MESNSGCGNANAYFVNLTFAFANRVPYWPKRIRHGKKRIKKLRKLMKDPSVDLWALDEVHFQQQGSRCRMWIPPEEKDPVGYHHPPRQRVAYFCARRL